MHNQEFFNVLDYIYIGIMLISSLIGLIKGFSKDFLGTCSWLLSGFLSIFAAPMLYDTMRPHITNVIMLRCVCMLMAFLGLLAIFLIITNLISTTVKNSIFSGIDRSFGMLFGLLRGMCLIFIVCILMLMFEVSPAEYKIIKESQISSIIFNNSECIISYLEKNKLVPKNLINKEVAPKSQKGYRSVFQLAPQIKQQLKNNQLKDDREAD